MKKIIFIDQNQALVKKVEKEIKYLPFDGVEAKMGNIFDEEGVIVSASNPSFSCGDGWGV